MADLPDPAEAAAQLSGRLGPEAARVHRARVYERRRGKKVQPPHLAPLPKIQLTGKTHVIIGDPHSKPDVPNYRFDWLGKLVCGFRPDVVVDIGDWFAMESLCHYDQGKKCFEGRRYWLDIEAGLDANDRFSRGLSRCSPRLIRCLGNHENRINRIVEHEPRFEGLVGTDDLMSAEFGWEEYPFLDKAVVDGVTYSHYFKLVGSERAISGVTPSRSVAVKRHRTAVFGHTHRFSQHDEPGPDGRITVFNAGCYFNHVEEYAKDDQDMWRAGILVLRDVEDGRIGSWEWISLERIQEMYG